MGNTFACDACESSRQADQRRLGYGDSPYSKPISKNLVRFWAEVYLMGQEGVNGDLQWQKVVPKLVPVNVARVRDSPCITHVSAYDTKIDKIMDVVICMPGTDVQRQSDCFVYWTTDLKTWGLNFITAGDALHFLDLIHGRTKGVISRRANSAASLANKQQKHSVNDPSCRESIEPSASRHSVRFVGVERVASPHSGSSTPTSARKTIPAPEDMYPSSPSMAAHRLSSWDARLNCKGVVQSINLIQQSSTQTSVYDDLNSYAKVNGPLPQNTPNPTCFDSESLARLLKPLDDAVRHDYETPRGCARGSASARSVSFAPTALSRSYTVDAMTRSAPDCRDAFNGSNSSISSQTDARPHVNSAATTPINQRSSLYLYTDPSGSTKAIGGSGMSRQARDQLATRNEADVSDSAASSDSFATYSRVGVTTRASHHGNVRPFRKGHLLLKPWLVPEGTVIKIVQEQWRQYWVVLRGVELVLRRIDGVDACGQPMFQENQDQTVIDMSQVLVQPLPEYPRREHVFCISTSTGNAYLLQADSDLEIENWMVAIHSAAALQISGTTSRDLAARNVRREAERVEQKIETTSKMLRLSSLPSVGAVGERQVDDWQAEIELLSLRLYTGRCYIAALKGYDLPNPARVLSSVRAVTKQHLSELGAFTPSTVHAFVSAQHSRAPPPPAPKAQPESSAVEPQAVNPTGLTQPTSAQLVQSCAQLVHITMPTQQVTAVSVCDTDSIEGVLNNACAQTSLEPDRFFVVLRKTTNSNEIIIPDEKSIVYQYLDLYDIEMREKLVYHVHLTKPSGKLFGLTIRAQRDPTRGGLRVWITAVDEQGPAYDKGITSCDELLAVNKTPVRSLSPSAIEELLHKNDNLCLVMRTKRLSIPCWLETVNLFGSEQTSGVLHHLSCESTTQTDGADDEPLWLTNHVAKPPGPVKYRSELTHRQYRKHRYSLPIIAAPPPQGVFNGNVNLVPRQTPGESTASASSSPFKHHRNNLAAASNRISCSEPGTMNNDQPLTNGQPKMTPTERTERIVFELLETERCYAEDLELVLTRYLKPLATLSLISANSDVPQVIASHVAAMLKFQRHFLDELREAAGTDFVELKTFDSPSQLRNGLLRLGGIFVNNAPKFKLYSSFCASHSRLLKLLQQEEKNPALQKFLLEQNMHRQHSATLESFLIKPVQRVLRYPLFLQQLKALTTAGAPEHVQISEALTKMEKVAEYINEMQRIYEEHGSTFVNLQAECQDPTINLDLAQLLMCGEVDWLNVSDDPASRRKSQSVAQCVCFVFRSAIILVSTEKQTNGGGRLGVRRLSKTDTSQPTLQRLIPIRETEVNGSELGSTDSHHMWILIHMDQNMRIDKVYHLANRRHDLKQQFLKAIRKAGLSLAKDALATSGSASHQNGSSSCSSSTTSTSQMYGDTRRNRTRLSPQSAREDPSVPSVVRFREPPASARSPRSRSQQRESPMSRMCHPPVVPRSPLQNGLAARPTSYYSNHSDAGYSSENHNQLCHSPRYAGYHNHLCGATKLASLQTT